jgi:microcin C transport system substrate-binding protein
MDQREYHVWRLCAHHRFPEFSDGRGRQPGSAEACAARTVSGDLDQRFGEVHVPPVSDGSGQDRELLRRAATLFPTRDASGGHELTLPDGKPFEIEFLDFDNALEPHTAPFIKI